MFPFDQPAPTAFYLVVYLVTFVSHLLPMAYVLGGAAVLLSRTLAGRTPHDDPLAEHLRQWLPFVLSMAITTGVAPLLFLQILYQRQFYSANLLLFHRWLAILPALTIGFYLLYLVKGNWLWRQPLALRSLAAAVVLASFAFIGWSWTENHLLSTAGERTWTEHYAAARWTHWPGELWPRIGVWLGGVFPVMGALVAWPLSRQSLPPGTARGLALFAIIGLAASLAGTVWYLAELDAPTRGALLSAPFRAYHAALAIGLVLQLAAWVLAWRGDSLPPLPRWLAMAGAVLAVVGVAVCREAIRASRVDLPALLPRHQAAAEMGGFWLFALFLVVNAAAIAGCVYVVARYSRPEDEDDAAAERTIPIGSADK